jgi:hypothetical protein
MTLKKLLFTLLRHTHILQFVYILLQNTQITLTNSLDSILLQKINKIGGFMSDQNVAVEKMHIQTLVNSDTDWAEDKPTLQELIEDHIMFQSKKFTDYYKEQYIIDQVKSILYDSNDDKLGRIRDVYDNEIEGIARFIAENHKTSNFAKWAYDEVMNNII